MTASAYFVAAATIGYLLGAIPFGKYYVYYFRGLDIQKIGSGRTGGTNSIRAGGWTLGFMTAFSDVLKGILAILVLRWFISETVSREFLPWLEITTGSFSVVGHNWSILAGMRGGAGTGPNVGWSSAIYPPLFPIAFLVMFGGIFLVGWASVASMMMALVIPIFFSYLYLNGCALIVASPAYIVGGFITAGIVAYALRGNFARLLRGEERVVGLRARWAKRRQSRKDFKEKDNL
ncbi:MAG: glycerol-3-phosphate acyltransferase [Chloroflexota bacterium]